MSKGVSRQPYERATARTTGKTTPSARAECRKLEKAGKLIPREEGPVRPPQTFGEVARDFWTWDKSDYIHTRLHAPNVLPRGAGMG